MSLSREWIRLKHAVLKRLTAAREGEVAKLTATLERAQQAAAKTRDPMLALEAEHPWLDKGKPAAYPPSAFG